MFNAQNRIRQLMAERGWTIYRLAQESGLSQTTISNIFKRNNQPSLPTVNAICDACGITLAQFFTENDTANSPNAKSELDNSVAALKEDQREALAAFIKTILADDILKVFVLYNDIRQPARALPNQVEEAADIAGLTTE